MPRYVTFVARWRSRTYDVVLDVESGATVGDLRGKLTELVAVSPSNQKFAGLTKSSLFKLSDDQLLGAIELKESGSGVVNFLLIGTPDGEIKDNAKDSPATKQTSVVNDLSLSFGPSSKIWQRLQRHTSEVQIHFITPPRVSKKLCVLDLDKTILDFTSKDESVSVSDMKRPHLDHFLSTIWEHYDIAIWSQTSWRWLELKLHELNLCNREEFSLCFCLDKSSMFRASELENEYVKPLALIFSHAPPGVRWGLDNTVHVDDLCRNFLLNQGAGITISPYQRDKNPSTISSSPASSVFEDSSAASPGPEGGEQHAKNDVELLLLGRYLCDIAPLPDLTVKSHAAWREEVLRAAAGGKSSRPSDGPKKS